MIHGGAIVQLAACDQCLKTSSKALRRPSQISSYRFWNPGILPRRHSCFVKAKNTGSPGLVA